MKKVICLIFVVALAFFTPFILFFLNKKTKRYVLVSIAK